MSTEISSSFNHFARYRFTAEYWHLSDEARARLRFEWLERLGQAAPTHHHYGLGSVSGPGDFMVWSAVTMDDPAVPERFFRGMVAAVAPFRRYLDPLGAYWGFTRISEYSRARSKQEIDPFAERSLPYLVLYPFTKTEGWYALDQEARQVMMNEHMGIGKRYREITQLLLYSTGVQDQEFVVVYETDDLRLFSRLVGELRRTEARKYTKRDTPVHVGIRSPDNSVVDLFP